MHVTPPSPAAFSSRTRGVRGFSLIEMVLVAALVAVVGAMAVPTITNMLTGMRVGMSAREVERELQTARLRAVSTNRSMLVRFNCPGTGQFRMVELIGTPGTPAAADDDAQAATRCSDTAYPYPDPYPGVFDIPNNDGPVKQLDSHVTFTSVTTMEFWPDGTVHVNTGSGNPWPQVGADTTISIVLQQTTGTSVAKTQTQKTIQVNGVGKITLQ